MKKDVTCIVCPLGCRIRVAFSEDAIHRIKDYQCEKGKDYAIQEIFNPVRMLTTTILVKNGELPLVSIKTNKSIPKDKLFDVMEAISNMEVEAPITIGDILVDNVNGMEVDVLATRNVEKNKK